MKMILIAFYEGIKAIFMMIAAIIILGIIIGVMMVMPSHALDVLFKDYTVTYPYLLLIIWIVIFGLIIKGDKNG